MTRREQRDLAVVLLYQADIQKEPPQYVLDIYCEEYETAEAELTFTKAELFGTFERIGEIDSVIASSSKGWTNDRISRVAMAILRLAVYEMTFSGDIPVSVAINEAVELAKKYEDEKIAAFINGVLSDVVKKQLKVNN